MKAAVIGLGSMGRRRIRLLMLRDDIDEVLGIDNREDRRKQAGVEYGVKTYTSLEEALSCNSGIEAVFISTTPLSHSKIIRECLTQGLHTFSEINLVDDGYDENFEFAQNKGLTLFLSSTPMYRKEIEYIKESVKNCKLRKSYIYHVGQFLPDWHPWESYKDFFVGNKVTNGCREIMAIEFPWIFDVFGFPEKYEAQFCKTTSLDIDYPDTFQILFNHPGGNMGILQIDVVSRKAVRKFECMSEELHISWDGTPNGLKTFDIDSGEDLFVGLYDSVDKRNEYSESIIENAYLAEIDEFLRAIKGEVTPRHTFEKDKEILRIIGQIGA